MQKVEIYHKLLDVKYDMEKYIDWMAYSYMYNSRIYGWLYSL